MRQRAWQFIWFVLMIVILLLIANARAQEFTLLRLVARQEVEMKSLKFREQVLRKLKIRLLLERIDTQVHYLQKLNDENLVSTDEAQILSELKKNVEKLKRLTGH